MAFTCLVKRRWYIALSSNWWLPGSIVAQLRNLFGIVVPWLRATFWFHPFKSSLHLRLATQLSTFMQMAMTGQTTIASLVLHIEIVKGWIGWYEIVRSMFAKLSRERHFFKHTEDNYRAEGNRMGEASEANAHEVTVGASLGSARELRFKHLEWLGGSVAEMSNFALLHNNTGLKYLEVVGNWYGPGSCWIWGIFFHNDLKFAAKQPEKPKDWFGICFSSTERWRLCFHWACQQRLSALRATGTETFRRAADLSHSLGTPGKWCWKASAAEKLGTSWLRRWFTKCIIHMVHMVDMFNKFHGTLGIHGNFLWYISNYHKLMLMCWTRRFASVCLRWYTFGSFGVVCNHWLSVFCLVFLIYNTPML